MAVLVLIACSWWGAAPSSRAASSSTTVGALVPSATYLSIDPADTPPSGNCLSGTPRTTIPSLAAGTGDITSQDCIVVFGSTNDTSMLRVRQADGMGSAMHRLPHGPMVTGWDEGDGDQIAETQFGVGGNADAFAVAIQPDEKIVVAGSSNNNVDFGVARFNTNGTVDAQVSTSITAAVDQAQDLVVQPDGKLLVVGTSAVNGDDVAIARYNANLTLDTNADADPSTHCSTDGKHTIDVGSSSSDSSSNVFLLGDGGFLVIGQSGNDTLLARFNSTCALDTSWGVGGKRVVSLATGAEVITNAVLQPDGKVIVVGSTASSAGEVLSARFHTDGSLDTNADTDPGTSWGATGIRVLPLTGTQDEIVDAALQPDGKLVIVGKYAGDDWLIGRLTTNGSWDTSFSVDGWDTFSTGGCCKSAAAVLVEATGSLLVVGGFQGAQQDTGFARWSSAGVRDSSFNGGTGYVVHNVGDDSAQEYIVDMVLGRDGRAVVAMTEFNPGWRAAVMQLDTTTVPDYQDTVNEWGPTSSSLFGACLNSVAGGAATDGTTWSTTGSCSGADADPWRPVAKAVTTIAKAPSYAAAAQANLRFGMRVTAGQAAGSYVAPITFEVIAPS